MLVSALTALFAGVTFLILRTQITCGSFPPPLSAEEEKKCLERFASGDTAAREALISHNLRLVAHIVKKYYTLPTEQDDLISIGTIGLIKAIDTYQKDKSARLSTYAARCIENEILMHFRAIRKHASDVSLSEALDTDTDGNALSLMDVLSCEDIGLQRVEDLDGYAKLYQLLQTCLTSREKEILYMRYGLCGQEPKTQRDVAAARGISRSYVSRIEKKIIEKLRKKMENYPF